MNKFVFSLPEDLRDRGGAWQQVSERAPGTRRLQQQGLGGDARQHARPVLVLDPAAGRDPHQGSSLSCSGIVINSRRTRFRC